MLQKRSCWCLQKERQLYGGTRKKLISGLKMWITSEDIFNRDRCNTECTGKRVVGEEKKGMNERINEW